MKKILTCLLATLGFTAACAQQDYEVDEFQTKGGKTVRMHALMHASIRIEFDGKEIEIDPVSKLRDRTVDYAAFPKADFIFVTHEHGDHYDEQALKLLSGKKTQVVLNGRCAEMFGQVNYSGFQLTSQERDAILLHMKGNEDVLTSRKDLNSSAHTL